MFILNGEYVASVPDGYITDELGNCIMGDRFYMQQKAATGKAPGVKDQKPAKVTKADLLAKLPPFSGLAKLTAKDLEQLINDSSFVAKLSFTALPVGRLKAPYIDLAKRINDKVDWAKLTVAELKQILEDSE